MGLKFKARDEGDVADILAETRTAMELRRFASENDVTRGRGTSKQDTARKIVDQAPGAALEALESEGHDFDLGHVVVCPDCGDDEPVGEFDDALMASGGKEVHERMEEGHEPRAMKKTEWLRNRK